jgi:hypothetical protein
MSCNRTQEAFRLLQRLCLFNHCDGLVISTADIANQLNVTMRTPYGEKIYFEQTCNINRVLDLINAREKRGIVLIFDFDLYYCNSNGNCVGDNKRIAEYYRDLLCEAVSKSKVAVIAESQYEHCGNYQNAMFVNIDGEEHLLFENGNLAKLHNN